MFWFVYAPGCAAIFLAAIIFIYIPNKRKLDDRLYNERQADILAATTNKIITSRWAAEAPREDLVMVLNSAVDVYNESLRGKNVEQFMIQHYQLVNEIITEKVEEVDG